MSPSVSQMTPAQRHLFMFLPSGAQQVFSVRDQIVSILGFIDHGVPSINALSFFSFCLSVVAFKSCKNVTAVLSSLVMFTMSLFLFLSPDPLFT